MIKLLRTSILLAFTATFLLLTCGATAYETSPSEQTALNNEKLSLSSAREFKPGLVRVDFSITSSTLTSWNGELRLSRGEFADLTTLGVNATSCTDFLFSDTTKSALTVHTRSNVTFCGIETTIIAPRDARLEINLQDSLRGKSLVKSIFVDRLIDSTIRIPLDAEGSEIEIARAPADDLSVRIERVQLNATGTESSQETTVFSPNDKIRLTVFPRSSIAKLPNELTLSLVVKQATTNEAIWSESKDIFLADLQKQEKLVGEQKSQSSPFAFQFNAPAQDGVFDITLALQEKIATSSPKTTFALTPTKRNNTPSVYARRIVQGIVASGVHTSTSHTGDKEVSLDDLRAELLETIDPTNATWYKNYSKRSHNPFYKSNNGKNSSAVMFLRAPSSITGNSASLNSSATDAPPTDSNSPMTFASEPNAFEENNVVLGQELPTTSTGPLPSQGNKSLLDFMPRFGGNDKTNVSQASSDTIFYRQRWEKDKFQTYLRNLDRKTWGLSGNLWEKPLSSGNSRPFAPQELAQYAMPQSRFLRLAPNQASHGISWEAYPIPIDSPGVPHILEVEYPASFPQKLGISILEQGPFGGLFPASFDLGLSVSNDSLSDRSNNETARYTALFWPKSNHPILLFSNCSFETAAVYGQIRIYKAAPTISASDKIRQGRTFGIALTSPDLCRQFFTVNKASSFGVMGSPDWVSFDAAITRALYYLEAANVDTMLLSCISNGSTIYPSKKISPSAQYDGGVFLPFGGDPLRKDVLSVAMTRFASCNKDLIPLINLNSSLPDIEAILNAVRSQSLSSEEQAKLEGVEWIGINGQRLIDQRHQKDGSGPYYNVLHPIIEKEALEIIEELLAHCAPHDSLSGIALDVGANGWLALPDDVYFGMDDETIARFVRESNLQEALSINTGRRVQELLLAKGPDRYRLRAEFIRNNCLNEWLEWRVSALYNFYRKIRQTIAKSRPDVRLYLVATHALDGPICRSTIYPSLANGRKLREALRLVGLDPLRFSPEIKRKSSGTISQVAYVANDSIRSQYDPMITLLRPEVLDSTSTFIQTALQDDLNDPEAIMLFTGNQLAGGSFFFHKTKTASLNEFSKVSPISPTIVELQTQATPVGYEAKRRFARTLAVEDATCFFDGGDTIPMGQEDALRDWIKAYKSLPNVRFKTWTPKSGANTKTSPDVSVIEGAEEKTIQPLVVRYYQNNKETWIYLLNAAQFHLGVKIALKTHTNVQFEVFSGDKYENPNVYGDEFEWNFTEAPYDLVAIRLEDPQATFETVEISRPQEICGPEGRLPKAVQDFVERVLIAKTGVTLDLRNGDFEESFHNIQDDDSSNAANQSNVEPSNPSAHTGILNLEMPKMNLFKKNRDNTSSATDDSSSEIEFDSTQIPGWRAFGPSDVDVRLDENVVNNGRASLRISSTNNMGGVICQPFDAPTTGRLCVQICFGVPVNIKELPLNVCLVGRKDGELLNRRIQVGSVVLKRAQKLINEQNDDGIVWVRDIVLFDRLPLDGLEELSLRFELCGAGTVWLDQIKLYKLAFADVEQNELMKTINTAEFRASKDRSLDVLFMLESYWARMLKEQIPDGSPLLTSRTRRASSPSQLLEKETETETPPRQGAVSRALEKLKFW